MRCEAEDTLPWSCWLCLAVLRLGKTSPPCGRGRSTLCQLWFITPEAATNC